MIGPKTEGAECSKVVLGGLRLVLVGLKLSTLCGILGHPLTLSDMLTAWHVSKSMMLSALELGRLRWHAARYFREHVGIDFEVDCFAKKRRCLCQGHPCLIRVLAGHPSSVVDIKIVRYRCRARISHMTTVRTPPHEDIFDSRGRDLAVPLDVQGRI